MTTEYNKLKQWQNKYHGCLALEFSNPEYFEVHHLLVLTFMLQTNGYNKEYFLIARELLKSFLNGSLTTNEFRKRFKSFEKNKNLNISSKDFGTEEFDWRLDILSLRIDTPEHYCQDVMNWAKDVLMVIDNY